MSETVTFEEVLDMAKLLSPSDQMRLIERLAPRIVRLLEGSKAEPRQSLRGLWQGLDITDEDLAEVRQEMWHTFPREDI